MYLEEPDAIFFRRQQRKIFKEVENVVAIKEATGSVAQASQLMYLTDGRIDLYSGEDGIVVPLMAIGAIGVISVWSNVAPAKVHGMCQSFFDGDLQTAMKIQRGTAACQCIILRGQPDSGEESVKPHGKRSWNTSFSFDGDDRCKCNCFGRCNESIWHFRLKGRDCRIRVRQSFWIF